MVFLDFSINNLTLMALTIATGFVVDDTVVIEAYSATSKKEKKPLAAAFQRRGRNRLYHYFLTFSLVQC